jgi:hypothetical protein
VIEKTWRLFMRLKLELVWEKLSILMKRVESERALGRVRVERVVKEEKRRL